MGRYMTPFKKSEAAVALIIRSSSILFFPLIVFLQKTHAHRKMVDDVPEDVKKQRLTEMQNVFRRCAEQVNRAQVGEVQLVLVEGDSRRSDKDLAGRNERNTKVIFPKEPMLVVDGDRQTQLSRVPEPGDYVAVEVLTTSQVVTFLPTSMTSFSHCQPPGL
jgi:hypothetical protein